MADTMDVMEWRIVDTILADTLEVGDYVKDPDGNIAEIIDLFEEQEVLLVSTSDDYGDLCEWPVEYDAMVDIYMLFG